MFGIKLYFIPNRDKIANLKKQHFYQDMSLVVVGLNHKTASIEIRERMSIAEDHIIDVVTSLCANESIKAAVVISTCNRTEFYLSCEENMSVTSEFCQWFNLSTKDLEQHLYVKNKLDCIVHLFEVSSGLDSMILGEAQILGQVKSAYEISKQLKKLDHSMDRLFQWAFRVAKSVRNDTDIGKNPVSVANSAVQLSKQIFGDLSQQKILMIGAGATAELLLRYLNKYNYQCLCICNRNLANADKLAQQFSCETFELKHLSTQISKFDLIFTATASQLPLINSSLIKPALQHRKHKPMVIIDLAIPRDVNPEIKKLNDVFYYSVDDLQKVISQNLKSREQSAIQALQIIKAESESFEYWLKGQQHIQLIHQFQKETAKIRKQSLDKAMKQLKNGTDVEEVIYFLANNLTNKLNHAPVKGLRNAIQSGDMNKIKHIKQLLNLQ